MKLSEKIRDRNARGEKAFIAYITAGDPSLSGTERAVLALSRADVDVIELGVPHSDPVADGPTNARAAERALKHNVSLNDILKLIQRIRGRGESIPIVLFTYLNPILRMGVKEFAAQAKACGVSGVLVVDLPPEEAEGYLSEMRSQEIETVFLSSPTTHPNRISRIADASTGFLYYVSRTGVTGTQSSLSKSLREEVLSLKSHTDRPVCVGFGISSPEQVSEVAKVADGVVVGSAFVSIFEKNLTEAAAVADLEKKARELVAPLREKKRESVC